MDSGGLKLTLALVVTAGTILMGLVFGIDQLFLVGVIFTALVLGMAVLRIML